MYRRIFQMCKKHMKENVMNTELLAGKCEVSHVGEGLSYLPVPQPRRWPEVDI